jgi:sulfur carrier protein
VLFVLAGLGMETLRINGVEKQFPDGTPETLAELLDQLKINQTTVVAQINEQIVERNKFAETKVFSHQSIELLRFVGGG